MLTVALGFVPHGCWWGASLVYVAGAVCFFCGNIFYDSMLTEVAALEMGPRGIRVNAVAPGFVHTPLTEGAAAVPGVVDEYVENTVLGRAGTPEDIAEAVAFLCSEKSSWLTGEVLDLNGGAHLKQIGRAHV